MSKINEVLNNKDSIIVFDVDGVLVPIEYGEYNHYYATDEEWAREIESGRDFYEDIRVVKTIKDYIETRDINKIYVITKVMNEKEFNDKVKSLNKHYGILSDNCFMVYSDDDKLTKLNEIKNKVNVEDKYIAMVDDTVSVLNNIMENSKFTTIHISTFLK